MERRARWITSFVALVLAAGVAGPALANPEALENARRLLNQNNPKQAYMELIKLESQLAGNVDYDYLLGVASLDSGKIDDAIIAFERVLAVNPNHAGAQMDLARAYFVAGSLDLAEASFTQLAASNPPSIALQTINRYLEAIKARKRQTAGGWSGWAELGIGYDDNITGVPTDFGAAAQQSFGIVGIEATGNSIKRKAAYGTAAAAAEYSHPLSGGWSLFGAGEVKGRGYDGESDFNSLNGEVRAGATLNDGATQWRAIGGYQHFDQQGAADTDPMITNDRRTGYGLGEWRYYLDPRRQVGLGLQYSQVRFPTNDIEDFNQILLSGSYLQSFETKGVPLLVLSAFVSDDKAINDFPDSTTNKSKNLAGLRSYVQYALDPKVNLFNALGVVFRHDKDAYARSTTVEYGKDRFGEFLLGLNWEFRKSCTMRAQWSYTRNTSNIDLYAFNRNEVSTAVRCETN
ncbi:MAG: tetratricopeptide repeat protein [Betaproteobacteria bacterium]|nr:tetratricopeptide repeat protein [Betaproteobacteria bacterium]